MTPKAERLVREKGDAITCEARSADNGMHAGVIYLKEGSQKKDIGHTDPVFSTAKEAVAAVEECVSTLRGEAPKPVEEEPKAAPRGRKSSGKGE